MSQGGLEKQLIQIDHEQGPWEKAEADPQVRATLIQALAWGATPLEATALINELGQYPGSLDGTRLKDFQGGSRIAKYIEMLRARPVTKDVMQKEGERVREYLLTKAKHARTYSWRFFPDTRLIVTKALRQGKTAHSIAQALTIHYGVQAVSRKNIEDAIKIHTKEGLIDRLESGFEPFSPALTDDDKKRWENDYKELFEAVEFRRFEKAWYWKRDDARAFVVALLEDDHVSPSMIAWALEWEFKKKAAYPKIYTNIHKQLPDRPDATFNEKRAELARRKGKRIKKDDSDRMRARAQMAKAEFFLYLQDVDARLAKSGREAQRKRREHADSERSQKFEHVLDAIKSRSRSFSATDDVLSGIKLWYMDMPLRSGRLAPSLFIEVTEQGKEFIRMSRHIRDELKRVAAGDRTPFHDALREQGNNPALEWVIFYGPDKKNPAAFSFDFPKGTQQG